MTYRETHMPYKFVIGWMASLTFMVFAQGFRPEPAGTFGQMIVLTWVIGAAGAMFCLSYAMWSVVASYLSKHQ